MQQEQVEWFESWFGSPYYRVLYQHRDQLEANEFADNLLTYLQPPLGSKMVDIACGEGRLAIQLASKGYNVIGLDLSTASIQKAKEFEQDNLQFMVHDMRQPFYINYFDFAFNFFTSFGYFEHQHDHELAAKAFSAGLRQGGLLVIDYLNKETTLANLVADETINRGSYNFHIHRSYEQNHFLKNIRFTDNEGRERQFTESVAAFSLADFIKIFKAAGLSLVATFGDYELNTYHKYESPRMIMVFKK